MGMTFSDRMILWLAQGLGSGRLRPGPGTWGSVVGFFWLLVLLSASNLWVWGVGTLLGLWIAIPVCGRAEVLLGQHDPGSVVLDEIAALPLVWIGPLLVMDWPQFASPVAPSAVAFAHWRELVAGFLAFRVFDIWKPGGIRRAQKLRGGAGVVADDVLAAVAAAPVAGMVAYFHWRGL